MFNDEQGKILLKIARASIAQALNIPVELDAGNAAWLQQLAATFVTLTQDGELRGCIGSVIPHCSLYEDLCHNARAAAMQDPRFSPLTQAEFQQINIEVSLLSKFSDLSFTSEADLLQKLRPGVDGILLTYGQHRATFLPQVWEHLPEPKQFLEELKYKAGLPAHFWASDIHIQRYEVKKWKE